MLPFYKALMKNFRSTGAFAPSTRYLANTVARILPKPFTGTLVELGPGTGNITKALIKAGVPEQQIIAIESAQEFARYVKTRFPNVSIIHGSAADLSRLVSNAERPITAVVSSLPLRSMPKDLVEEIIHEIDSTLAPTGYYIQYTYFKKQNPIIKLKSYHRLKSKLVLANLPPARVDVFQKD